MRTFIEWLKAKEMAGAGAVYDGTSGPDFQWMGAPPKKRKRKKRKRRENCRHK